MSRRVRRSGDTVKSKQGYTTQRDGEFSSRKTARFTDNYIQPSNEKKKEPYCVTYFKNNPDSMDTRTPSEKLKELNERLDADLMGDINLEPYEKFKTLTQIKSITYMINGENSSEMLRAYAHLGYFYNDNNRPQSAIRILEKAHNLERTNTIDEDESINIAIETAKAHLALKAMHGSSGSKQVMLADEALSPYYDKEIERVHLRHKRDLIRSRIFAAQKKYDESIKSYEFAIKSLKELNENVETEAEANIFIEMAITADRKHKKSHSDKEKAQSTSQQQDQTQAQSQTLTQSQGQNQMQNTSQSNNSDELPQVSRQAGMYYQRAYKIFTNLGMEENAKNIEPLLLSDEYSYTYYVEEEEEEEEEANDISNSVTNNSGSNDENHVTFAPKEPTDEASSRGSSRRRQFKEKTSNENENSEAALEKKQNDIISGLINDNENEEEEGNQRNNEEEDNENAKNEEEESHENNEEEDEEGNPKNSENAVNNEEENPANDEEENAENNEQENTDNHENSENTKEDSKSNDAPEE